MAFAEESDRTAMLTEVATREAVGLNFGQVLGLLPDPDPILVKRGEGVEVLREIRADGKVISSIQTRKLGTLKKQDYLFEPGAAEGEEPTPEGHTALPRPGGRPRGRGHVQPALPAPGRALFRAVRGRADLGAGRLPPASWAT